MPDPQLIRLKQKVTKETKVEQAAVKGRAISLLNLGKDATGLNQRTLDSLWTLLVKLCDNGEVVPSLRSFASVQKGVHTCMHNLTRRID